MYNVVKQIKRSFTVFTALIITVVTTRVRAVNFKTCGPEELAQCGNSLSVLTDKSLTFVKSKEDLDMVCPDLDESLSCIFAYSRLCMDLKQRVHFRKLFHGTGSMVRDLCKNGTYQDEFLSYAPCMQKVSSQTEVCFNKYAEAITQIQTATNKQKEIEDAAHKSNHRHHNKSDENVFRYQKAKREAADGLKSVCCSFQEYVDCSTQAVRTTCGNDAAHFSRAFFDKMALPMINMHCKHFSAGDCREKGYHIKGFHTEGLHREGFHTEGYYSNAPQVTSHITALSIVTLLAFLLR